MDEVVEVKASQFPRMLVPILVATKCLQEVEPSQIIQQQNHWDSVFDFDSQFSENTMKPEYFGIKTLGWCLKAHKTASVAPEQIWNTQLHCIAYLPHYSKLEKLVKLWTEYKLRLIWNIKTFFLSYWKLTLILRNWCSCIFISLKLQWFNLVDEYSYYFLYPL